MKWLIVCVFCFLCCACSSSSSVDKKTLRLHFLSEANSLDPRYGYEIPANHAVKMLFEGLMRINPKGELVPGVATGYTVSEDQCTYLFTLRSSRWSNGDPVTAHDFEYTWKCVIDPVLPTQGAADFYPIKNVESIVQGLSSVAEAGITALDDHTLQVVLEYPTPYFPELTTSSAFLPVHASTSRPDPFAEVYTISNGPFVLKKWSPNDAIELERNRCYWNTGAIFFDKIEIAIIEDVATQLALFEKGSVDWLGKPFTKLPLDAVPSLQQREVLTHFPERAVYWYFLNTKKFPFNHKKIRQALAYAIDRNNIVTHLLKEGEVEAMGVNRGETFFTDGAHKVAVQLFEEALEELGLTRETFPSIPISYCGIETNHRIASVVQQQWQEVLGINVKLDPQEWTAFYDNLSEGKCLAGGLSWHARVRDPIYNLQLFKYAGDRLNMSFWEDPHYVELIERAQAASDPSKRQAFLVEAEAFLMEEMPVIPIYFLTISYAKNPLLKGVYISDINEIDFAWAYK